MRAAWAALGLTLLPARSELAANTLSAIRYPSGVDASLVGRLREAGLLAAGGLYPGLQQSYFRIGHMGWVVTQPELLLRTVAAVEAALAASGHAFPGGAGIEAVSAALER